MLQRPVGFTQRQVNARHVADAEGDRIAVELAIGKRQRLRVGFDEGHAIVEAASPGAFRADAQHFGVDVGDRHVRLRPASLGNAEGDVPGAAGDVEMRVWARSRRTGFGDENILPDPVEAERHQVIHHVIAVRDFAEYCVHKSLLFVHLNGALAEMRVPWRSRHRVLRGSC